MAKKTSAVAMPPIDADEPALVPGNWYMWTTMNGFTFIGQHVRSMGVRAGDRDRFSHHTYLLNAGGLMLSEICRSGPGTQTKLVPEFPGCWNGALGWWTDYFGPRPWVIDHDD